MTVAVTVSHVLNGTVHKHGRWTATCACGWHSEPCRLPGLTFIQWLSHRMDPEAS